MLTLRKTRPDASRLRNLRAGTERIEKRDLAGSIRTARAYDEDAGYGLALNHIMVFEADEPLGEISPILAPDGGQIFHEYYTEKQGFIGFIPPSDFYDAEPAEGEDAAADCAETDDESEGTA